jgi:OmpA-OmpF porin, OOP family
MIKPKPEFELLNYYYLCFLFLFISIPLKSQNLVINPSFEQFINFDTAKFIGWHKVQISDTPDYFNLGNSNPFNNIFNKYIGGINPKSGTGFVGIFCYRVNPDRNIKNIREIIETSLSSTLEKDSLYKVEISLCLDAESNIAIKNFGVYFSNSLNQVSKDNHSFSIKPQIEFNSSFLDSTKSWITLQSFYKAGGFEKYLAIGNFLPDRSTTIKKMTPQKVQGKKEKWDLIKNEKSAYYYVDDVVVQKVTIARNQPVLDHEKNEQSNDTLFKINEITIDSSIVLKNIIFEFNKSDLLPESYYEINKLYRLMISNPNIRIKLEGHTDNVGGYDFNLKLSVRRVESVTAYLINKGIDPNRVEFAGYSYSFPLESNQTEEGRKINRRVTFKIIQK